jgi:hypothetical protein
MVEKVATYGTRKTIMIGQDSYYLALPCVVSGTANSVIKAGQPLYGNIQKRDTAFTLSGGSGATPSVMNLHDVKLDAQGKGNATVVIRGCVDLLKLDSAVATALKASTPEGIVLVEGSAI